MPKNDEEKSFANVRIAWARWIYGNSYIKPCEIRKELK